MDAKEYIKKNNDLKEVLRLIQRQISDLRKQYLAEHCQYKVGDKVHVEIPEYISNLFPQKGKLIEAQSLDAFVCHNIEIDEKGRIWPTLHQVKKDDTESNRYVYLSRESEPIITKI